MLTLTICNFQRGRGIWKFNCSLLKDKEYLITINNLIDTEKMNYALPVYHPQYVTKIHDNDIEFIISDNTFLETLPYKSGGKLSDMLQNLKRK